MSDLNAAPDAAVADAPTADATPVAESSAPESTADIARAVIEEAEEAEGDVAVEEAPAPEATAAPEETPEPVAVPEVDDIGLPTQKRADGREHRIPASRVREMVEKKVQKVQAEWEARVAEHTQKVAAFEQEFQHMAAVEQMMQTDPDAFMQSLVQINPAYARYLQGGGQQPQHHPAPASAGMPEPDYDLGNGQRTYSAEGLQKLLAWQRQEAIRQAEERVAQRYAPIEQQFRAQAERQQALPKVQALIQEARSWPGFTENERAITQAFMADKSLTLERAYLKVMTPKMAADRNAMKQEWLKEMKGRPASTSVPVTTPATPSTAKTTADIAREVIARAK